MRALLVTLALLSLLTFLPSPASAQTQGTLTLTLEAPETPLREASDQLTFAGIATLTVDLTAYLSMTGIPVEYVVTAQPEWATVIISPATDVFYLGAPGAGPATTVSRTFTVTVTLKDAPAADANELVEITAVTSPGSIGGSSFTGRGTTPIAYDAPDAPCPEHAALSNVDWASVAVEAADAYNTRQASAEGSGDEEMTVQTGGSSTLPMPWLIVGGFALIGAGVGLVLRRRLH